MNVIHIEWTLKGERREEVTAAWCAGGGVGRVAGCGGCCSVHLRGCLLLMVVAVNVLQMMSVRLQVMSYLLLLLLLQLRVVVTVRVRLLLVAVSERCCVRLSDVLLLLLQCLLLLWLQECTKQMLHSTPLPTTTDGRGGGRVAVGLVERGQAAAAAECDVGQRCDVLRM